MMPQNSRGEVRDSIKYVWGDRTPYKHEWPTRCDASTTKTPDKWVQSACILCRYVDTALEIGSNISNMTMLLAQ